MTRSDAATVRTPMPVIAARDLDRRFGAVHAVRGLSFSVEPGQILGVLGPNGAGKTTTINMLTTLTSIEGGSASVAGFDVATEPDRVREVIGLAGQAAAVDEQLTARENLELFGRLYKLPRAHRRRRAADLIERFDLGAFADRPAGTYSGGQRRRLDIAAALVADPPALFLDEPTTGLDPRSRAELWAAITALAERGTAIVLTTQYLDEADQLADHILVLDQGRIIASGTPAALKRGLERDVLEVTVADGELDRALACLGPGDGVAVDAEASVLRIAVGGDAAQALAILGRLQSAGIEVTDFQLRRPTLDDVFLALTGHEASSPETAGQEPTSNEATSNEATEQEVPA